MPSTANDTAGARALLVRAGWRHSVSRALTPDASARRYWRLVRPDGSRAVLMSDPTGAIARFRNISAHLDHLGLSAPKCLAVGPEHMLIEDFGNTSVTAFAQDPAQEVRAYALAGTVLAHFQPDPPAYLPHLNSAYLVAGLDVFHAYDPQNQANDIALALGEAMDKLPAQGSVMCHRDFHADNLMWLRGRGGLSRLGLLDFQDAMQGPVAYDLVSLLFDARRDVAHAARQAARQSYCTASGRSDSALDQELAVLGLARNLRILGLFAKFATAGRTHYLDFVPRVRGHVAAHLSHPACRDLARLLPGYLG